MCIRDRPYGISQSEFLRQAIRRATIRPVVHVSSVNDELLSAVGKLTAEYGSCLLYTSSEKDILKLVNVIIANTKGDGEKSSEDFWVKAERLVYCALIGYI